MRPHSLLVPLAFSLALGISLSLWTPLRIVSIWWIAAVCGAALGAAGAWTLIRVWDRFADGDLGVVGALLITYTGASLIVNTWWPLLLIPALLAGIVRWRAVQIQTGHRQPG